MIIFMTTCWTHVHALCRLIPQDLPSGVNGTLEMLLFVLHNP